MFVFVVFAAFLDFPSPYPFRARPPDMVVECFDWVSRQEDICLGRVGLMINSREYIFHISANTKKWYFCDAFMADIYTYTHTLPKASVSLKKAFTQSAQDKW